MEHGGIDARGLEDAVEHGAPAAHERLDTGLQLPTIQLGEPAIPMFFGIARRDRDQAAERIVADAAAQVDRQHDIPGLRHGLLSRPPIFSAPSAAQLRELHAGPLENAAPLAAAAAEFASVPVPGARVLDVFAADPVSVVGGGAAALVAEAIAPEDCPVAQSSPLPDVPQQPAGYIFTGPLPPAHAADAADLPARSSRAATWIAYAAMIAALLASLAYAGRLG